MGKLQDAVKHLSATHVLLFLIAIGLIMNCLELKVINANLHTIAVNADLGETDVRSIANDLDPTLKNIEMDLSQAAQKAPPHKQ